MQTFGGVKRLRLHILFWLFYLLQFFAFEFLWARGAFPQFQLRELILPVTESTLLYFIPQAGFAYYLYYVGVDRILKRKHRTVFIIIEILAVLFFWIVIDRALTNYIELPFIHHNLLKPAPLLDPRKIPIVILYLGYAAGLFFTVQSVRNQMASKEREKNLVKEKLETELKFLRSQTNPHFLFNTLNNIYALARKKSDKTPEVIMKLSDLLSFMLYQSGKDVIAIEEEIKMIEDYIELQKIRYNDRLSLQLVKNIDKGSQQIAPLLLMPLVENAFKHGASETRFDSFINIDICLENGLLHFFIENSIENCESKKENCNIGLSNIKRQLELMYKEYKLNIDDKDKTFKVNIIINLNSYGKI